MDSLKNLCHNLIIENYKSYKTYLWTLPIDLRYQINKVIVQKNKLIKKYQYHKLGITVGLKMFVGEKIMEEIILEQTKLKSLLPNYKIVQTLLNENLWLCYGLSTKGYDLDYMITNNDIYLNFIIIKSVYYWELGCSMDYKYKVIPVINDKKKFYDTCISINKNPHIERKIKIINAYPL